MEYWQRDLLAHFSSEILAQHFPNETWMMQSPQVTGSSSYSACNCGQQGGANHKRNCPAYSGKFPERREQMSQIDDAFRQVMQERAQAEELSLKIQLADAYGEDIFTDGAVLRFKKTYDEKIYTYAALKTAGRWYITGRAHNFIHGSTWNQFVTWLVSGTPTVDFDLMVRNVEDVESEVRISPSQRDAIRVAVYDILSKTDRGTSHEDEVLSDQIANSLTAIWGR